MGFDLNKLGVKKNIPKINFLEYTGIMEAPEKWGKTTFAMLYPNSILLASEKGYKAQVANFKDINVWSDFMEFVDLLEENREDIGKDVQTIIIDTVDELYPKVAPYICRKKSNEDGIRYREIKDIPYGQGWGYSDEEFKKQISRILNMGFSILYLTHSKVKTIKPKDGEPYDVYTSTMPDRCANIVYPACDYIIFGHRKWIGDEADKQYKRVMTVRGNENAVAGNRVYFDEDIVFDTEEEAFEKFKEAFKKSILNTLEKKGVNVDISKLEKEQEKEREQNVREYISKQKEDLPTLIGKIKDAIKQKMADGTPANKIMETLSKFDIKDPNKIGDTDIARQVLDAFIKL